MPTQNRNAAPNIVIDSEPYRERLHLALEAAGMDLWENDLISGEVTHRVSRILSDLGYDSQESLVYMDDLFALVHPGDLARVQAAIAEHLNGRTRQYRCEFRLRSRDGAWVWYANYGKIMTLAEPAGRRFIGVTFNIDDRKRQEEEISAANYRLAEQNRELDRMNAILQTLATTDALTGLANRRCLFEMGEKECRRAQRQEQPLSLLIVDIDHFKCINDTWGHPAGDRVICAVGDLCRKRFRSDIDVVARIGGEEFAILLPATAYTDAWRLAQWLCESVAEQPICLGHDIVTPCSVSIGVATLTAEREITPDCAARFSRLLAEADSAMYRAKAGGRNQIQGADGLPRLQTVER